jgi:hypothetical protein
MSVTSSISKSPSPSAVWVEIVSSLSIRIEGGEETRLGKVKTNGVWTGNVLCNRDEDTGVKEEISRIET